MVMLGKKTKKHIDAAERRLLVIRLRRDGLTFEEIATAVKKTFYAEDLPKNYNARQACQDVQRVLDKINRELTEDAEQLKALQMQRLGELWKVHFSRAKHGDEKSSDICLKIIDRINKLNGLETLKIETVNPITELIKAACANNRK